MSVSMFKRTNAIVMLSNNCWIYTTLETNVLGHLETKTLQNYTLSATILQFCLYSKRMATRAVKFSSEVGFGRRIKNGIILYIFTNHVLVVKVNLSPFNNNDLF